MKSRPRSRRTIVGISLLASLSMLAAACGGDDDDGETSAETTEAAAAATTAAAATAAPEESDTTAAAGSGDETTVPAAGGTDTTADAADAAEWDAVVAAAKEEGSVTIYSGQALDNLNSLADRFKEEYGITVEVVRAVDNDLHAKLQAERDTGSAIADVMVNATLAWQLEKSAEDWFTPVDLPAFDNPDYNSELNISEKSDYFVSNAAVLTYGWNTDLWPQGLSGYEDLLDPELKGKIGVIEPTAGSIVDFYLYLEEEYGPEFVEGLAAQEPRIYPSSLPMGEALVSGEIAAGSFVQVQTFDKELGAPTDSGLADTIWGAIFNAAVMSNAPHPNAAQVLANFIITPEGQEAIAFRAASSLPDIEGTVAITDDVRRQDLDNLTPEKVAEYQARWAELFT